MTRQEALEAILVGYRRTVELINQGYTLFGTGEMGVGNTTTSAAVIAATLGLPAQEVTGYGAGVTEKMKAHKTAVIQEAVTNHAPYSHRWTDFFNGTLDSFSIKERGFRLLLPIALFNRTRISNRF